MGYIVPKGADGLACRLGRAGSGATGAHRPIGPHLYPGPTLP